MRRQASILILAAMLLFVALPATATNLTTDQILNASFDISAGALKVQWAKNDAEIVSALTNSVYNVFDLKHTTTGTPANGIGTGQTFTDATPDVSGCRILTTSSNTGATAITDLDNPVVGSIVCIVGGSATNSSTIADSGNFALSAAFTAGLDDNICLYVQADNDYIEMSRTDN